MNESCEADFASRILPEIDDNSVLFIEGLFAGMVPNTRKDYEPHLSKVSPALVASGKRPTLGFVDPRARENTANSQRLLNDITDLILFGSRFLVCEDQPKTSGEVISLIKTKGVSIECRLYAAPDQQLRSAANRVRRQNESFDAAHIRWVNNVRAKHASCYVLAGAAHCLSLYAQTDWDIVLLDSELTSDPKELLAGYLNVQWFPRVMNKFISGT
jgi:hypothetical protein